MEARVFSEDEWLAYAKASADRLIARKVASKDAEEVKGDVVLQYLFDKQREVANDDHRFITACCGRRAGKTHTVAALMLRAGKDHANRSVLYLSLTAKQAKANIWPTLKHLNSIFGLGGVVREGDLTMTMPNGAVLSLGGVDTQKDIETKRGQGFALVIIDECQSIPEHVRSLVDDVIAPALADVPGRLIMIGTPSMLPSGYWFKSHHNTNDVWGHHEWTMWENPNIPDPDATLAAECARRGVTPENVSIQREWKGKWVRDMESAVFAFDEELNSYDREALHTFKGRPGDLAIDLWKYVIAVDLGGGVERDNDAISVLAYHPFHRATWLVEEHIDPKQDVTGVCVKVKGIQERLGQDKVMSIVVDTGGIGAKVALEMASRHQLSIVAAKKQEKWTNIELLNAACRNGEFFAYRGSSFASESGKVEKDWTKSTPEKFEIKGHMPDICDSVLYGYVESFAWISKEPKREPPQGSKAWAERVRKKLFEQAQAEMRATKANEHGDFTEMDDWGGGDSGWGG